MIEHDVYKFPLNMGVSQTPYQFIVNDKNEFLTVLYRNLNTDVFASVHSLYDRENMTFNKLFFDFDNKDLTIAYEDTLKFVNYLRQMGVKPRVFFSGNKGFHVYIHFPYTKIEDYSDRVEYFINELVPKLSSIDVPVCIDYNRIARVPGSLNTKSNRYCVPVDIFNFKFENVLYTPQRVYESQKFIDWFMGLELPKVEVEYSIKSYDFQSELQYILDNASNITDGRKNLVWKIIIPSLLLYDFSFDEILGVLEKFYYDAYTYYTPQQKRYVLSVLKRTKQKGIFPMKLKNFKQKYEVKGL